MCTLSHTCRPARRAQSRNERVLTARSRTRYIYIDVYTARCVRSAVHTEVCSTRRRYYTALLGLNKLLREREEYSLPDATRGGKRTCRGRPAALSCLRPRLRGFFMAAAAAAVSPGHGSAIRATPVCVYIPATCLRLRGAFRTSDRKE